ncbi:ketopantoate reductase family protein [Streptomyces sp. NPDC090052]|uniref:ketopantoate reductase family protein n=1 Tax=unclassified Streptomyces TaxID=2593676 RepID=UPI002257FA9C|nr:2-dehydropantoate 2-reductase N-terminal domain-containing protein [Streptomyces sp. NBC_01306]MCX4723003.1 ketopantoate reductase family protein [Streptomyces sp. NBC_01306]
MRYIIIGAGAVGGIIGGRLSESGSEVVLVARGAHYEALRDGGLRIATPEGTRTLALPVADGPAAVELRPDDVLVLTVKTQDSIAALDAWGPRPVAGTGATAAEVLPLVCAQNGVESERLALRSFRRVYGMCVWLPATFLEPGSVAAAGSPLSGMLHIGRYPAGTDRTARQISADLEKAPFEAPVVPDVMRWKYGKLLSNLVNSLQAACGIHGTDPAADAIMAELLQQAEAEGRAVYAAAGIEAASAEEQQRVRGDKITQLPAEGRPRGGGSSWQSLSRGTGTIEADFLNGEIALLGRLHGVPTPVNDVLQRVANTFARERRPAGSMPAAELAALVADAAQ